MKNVFAALRDAGCGVLCMVLEKSGSAPRGPGANMALLPDGAAVGTVGGGLLEYEVLQAARTILTTKGEAVRDFVLDNTQAGSLGMVCGGRVRVSLRYVTARDLPDPEPDPQVYVFGGGHVAQALVPVLAGLDFSVTVLEERPQFAAPGLFPGAVQVILCDFLDLDKSVTITPQDYVVVMTRGHQGDYEILTQILRKRPYYMGCIGSRRKAALTRERLLSDGFSTETVEKLHSPIGLDIAAETPAEIAISIAAELILCRRGENP